MTQTQIQGKKHVNFRSKIKVKKNGTHCLSVIHLCAKYNMPMSKSKEDVAQTQSHGKKTNFDTNVGNTCSHGYTTMCQNHMPMS